MQREVSFRCRQNRCVLILPHAEGKLWIKEQLDELGIIFENTAIVGGWFCQYFMHYQIIQNICVTMK